MRRSDMHFLPRRTAAAVLLMSVFVRPGAGLSDASAASGSSEARQLKRQQAVRAFDVHRLLGVQPDLTQGNWSSIPEMVDQARYAGVDVVRAGMPTPSNWTTRYDYAGQLATAGLKLDFVVDTGATPAANVQALKAFLAAHPGSVAFVEGPNEPNNFGVNYAHKTGVEGAVAWQRDFYAAMKADPATAGVPVYGIISWPNVASASDVNNLHPYPKDGDQPRARIAQELADQNAVDPGKPFGITEMGYYTLPGDNPQGVDEATQARLLLNAYMDAADLGARSVVLYALRDYPSADAGARYGLFRNDNTPKPAAAAFHNLQAVLADPAAGASTFEPRSLEYATTAPRDVHSMLMQKSTGEFVLALWREPDVWDQAAKRPVHPAGVTFSLHLANAADISVHDPLAGGAAVETASRAKSLSLTVVDHPILVVLRRGT